MTEIHDLDALELAASIRKRELSPVEITEHYLARIERLGDELGAFVTVTPESATAAARAALERLDEEPLPPLFGVPTAVKDLTLTAGVRTTFGSVLMRDFVPEISDEVVLRMEAAGMVSLGKTNAPEFGAPCYTEPEVAPPARTPYDLTRSAGGSSGGAAAAVAGGLVPVAQGSDGGGSIRIPASVCGLVGLKPSRGRVSHAPVHGDVTGLSTSGAIARTVRDAAAFLDAIAGPAVGDPAWAPQLPADQSYLGWCEREPGRLRIASFTSSFVPEAVVDPECAAGCAAVAEQLSALGHELVQVDVPMPESALPTFETVWAVSTGTWPVAPEREPLLRPLTQWLRERGRQVSGPQYGLALAGLRQVAAQALTQLAPYDAVLTPTLAQLPAPVGGIRNDDDPAADFEAQKRFTPFAAMWNVTGMPAVSLPLHWTDDGLPVGVMLAGRPAEEHLLLALGAQLEAAMPWHHHHPACW
jgi:amidase